MLVSWMTVLLGLFPGGAQVDEGFPFERVGEEYTAAHPFGSDGEVHSSLEGLLQRHFVQASLGLFDVSYPVAALRERDAFRQFQELCMGLLQLQDRFLYWTEGAEPRRGRWARDDLESVAAWVKGWKPSELAALGDSSPSLDLTEALEPEAEAKAALASFRDGMRRGTCVGAERAMPTGERMLLAPTRTDFVGIASFAGLHDPSYRPILWAKSVPQWTVFRWSGSIVLALEHPAGDEDYRRGLRLDAREKTGLLQHVLHHAMTLLTARYFATALDPTLEAGLGTMIVIDMLGENNSRVGGATSGDSTPPRSKFVRGGQSSGGKLPQVSADTRWRAEKGKDYFEDVLRRELKSGMKEASQQHLDTRKASFALESATDPRSRLVVTAPFLGDAPGTPTIPPEYTDDSAEFFRAYSCAFARWLRDRLRKTPSGRDAREAFADLLTRAVPGAEAGTRFEQLVQDVYGLPLTSSSEGEDSLEARFLKFLGAR